MGEDNTLNNLVTIDLENVDTNNFTGLVTIDGLPDVWQITGTQHIS
ncbi:MAG: hypothetical protein ACLTY6_11545 [Clostridium perfringens]